MRSSFASFLRWKSHPRPDKAQPASFFYRWKSHPLLDEAHPASLFNRVIPAVADCIFLVLLLLGFFAVTGVLLFFPVDADGPNDGCVTSPTRLVAESVCVP